WWERIRRDGWLMAIRMLSRGVLDDLSCRRMIHYRTQYCLLPSQVESRLVIRARQGSRRERRNIFRLRSATSEYRVLTGQRFSRDRRAVSHSSLRLEGYRE